MKQKSVLVMLDPLSLPRLEAILAYAREHGWAVILEDRLPEGGLKRIDAAIVSLRGRKEHLAKIRKLQKDGKPVVDLTIACPKVKLPRVVSDHKALGTLAARDFLERGFTHFAWYASGSSHVHVLRRQGFAQTLRSNGFTHTKLSSLANLPALPRPLALLAFDESDAAHVISFCRQQKMDVPGDVAVLGIGNDPFLCENGEITISSVDQNLRLAAHEACALLDKLMAQDTKHQAPGTKHQAPSTKHQAPFSFLPPASYRARRPKRWRIRTRRSARRSSIFTVIWTRPSAQPKRQRPSASPVRRSTISSPRRSDTQSAEKFSISASHEQSTC